MAYEDITLVWREFKPMSLATPALAGGFFTTSATWEAHGERNQLKNIVTCPRPCG